MAVVAVVHLPSGGHVRPLLPLVAALGERGSRIVEFPLPEWEAECVAAGGEFRAVPDIGIDVTEPPPNPIGVAELIARGTELATPWLSEQLLEIGADVVLRDSFAQYGRYAANQASVPQVVFSPMMALHRGIRPALRSVPAALAVLAAGTPSAFRLRRISRRMEQLYGAPMGGWLDVLAGRYGCTTLIGTSRGPRRGPRASRGKTCGSSDHFAPRARRGRAGAGARCTARGRGARVRLARHRVRGPPCVLSRCCARARPARAQSDPLGRQDLTAGPWRTARGCHGARSVDQLAVLSRSSMFITHGGFNSVQEALVAGVPMLLFPQMQEQVLNADRVSELGACCACAELPPGRSQPRPI